MTQPIDDRMESYSEILGIHGSAEPEIMWTSLKGLRYLSSRINDVRPDIAAFIAAARDVDAYRQVVITKDGIDYAR